MMVVCPKFRVLVVSRVVSDSVGVAVVADRISTMVPALGESTPMLARVGLPGRPRSNPRPCLVVGNCARYTLVDHALAGSLSITLGAVALLSG